MMAFGKKTLIAGVTMAALAVSGLSAAARTTHRSFHNHHRYAQHYKHLVRKSLPHGRIVTVSTAAGPITVASTVAGRFQHLIAQFKAMGYSPHHIGCFARSGHVRHSLHYRGEACDFDQSGWGRTTAFMHRAHAIIVANGFRDGCEFHDCGHVDTGQSIAMLNRRSRFAARREATRYALYVRRHRHHIMVARR